MEILVLFALPIILFAIPYGAYEDLPKARKFYFCVSWTPSFLLLLLFIFRSFLESKFKQEEILFIAFSITALSLTLGSLGLILFFRSLQKKLPVILLFILVDIAFFPTAYWSRLFFVD